MISIKRSTSLLRFIGVICLWILIWIQPVMATGLRLQSKNILAIETPTGNVIDQKRM